MVYGYPDNQSEQVLIEYKNNFYYVSNKKLTEVTNVSKTPKYDVLDQKNLIEVRLNKGDQLIDSNGLIITVDKDTTIHANSTDYSIVVGNIKYYYKSNLVEGQIKDLASEQVDDNSNEEAEK
ncbi:hypothetical protein ACDI16_13310, partial [Oceanobacillus caeni]